MTIKERLANLIGVKKIISIVLTIVFCILALRGNIESKEFMTIFLMIISFYFGASSSREAVIKDRNSND